MKSIDREYGQKPAEEEGKFAAAQRLLRAAQDLDFAEIASAAKQIYDKRNEPTVIPETVLSHSRLRNVSNKILKHGSLDLSVMPFKIEAGWQIEF